MVPEMVQDGSDMVQMICPRAEIAHYMQGLLMVLGTVQDSSDRVQTVQFLCLEMGGT